MRSRIRDTISKTVCGSPLKLKLFPAYPRPRGLTTKIVFDKFHVARHLHEAVSRSSPVCLRAGCSAFRTLSTAKKFFGRWFWRATHSRLRPLAEMAKLIRRHLPNVPT